MARFQFRRMVWNATVCFTRQKPIINRKLNVSGKLKTESSTDTLVPIVIGTLGGALMVNGILDLNEQNSMSTWEQVPGQLTSVSLDPVSTSRSTVSSTHSRYNARAGYAYSDRGGTTRSGEWRGVISAAGH